MTLRPLALALLIPAAPLEGQAPGVPVDALSGGTITVGEESHRVDELVADWNRTDGPGGACWW